MTNQKPKAARRLAAIDAVPRLKEFFARHVVGSEAVDTRALSNFMAAAAAVSHDKHALRLVGLDVLQQLLAFYDKKLAEMAPQK